MRKYFIKATFFMEWRQNEKWGEKIKSRENIILHLFLFPTFA